MRRAARVGLLWLAAACGAPETPGPPGEAAIASALQEALGHLQAGRYLPAVEACQRGLAVDSTHAELNNLLATVEAGQGRYAPAIAALERALRHRPDYALGHLNLGAMLFKLGHFDRAEERLLAAARLQPDHSSVHRRLAELDLATGRPDEAVARMRRALELFPDDATLTFYLGRALEDSGRQDEALGQYRRAAALDIGFAEACYRLAVLARRRGEVALADSAMARFQHLQQIGGGDPDAAKQLDKLRAAVLEAPEEAVHQHELGAFFAAHGYVAEAVNRLRRAADLAPDDAGRLTESGRLLARQRQVEAALEFYERALRVDSSRVEALVGAANLALLGGRPEAAIPRFERALGLDPGNALARLYYGLALRDAGRRAEADRALRQALDDASEPALRERIQTAIAATAALRREGTGLSGAR